MFDRTSVRLHNISQNEANYHATVEHRLSLLVAMRRWSYRCHAMITILSALLVCVVWVTRACYSRNNTLDRYNPWPHVANCHICISQQLSTCCYLFTVSNSGLFSVQRPRPASHAHFRPSHIPELICGVNSSIDLLITEIE